MYAIRHKKTHEWVYGTDYRCYHKRKDGKRSYSQRTSHNKALIFEDLPNASFEFQLRGISSRYYEIVEVEIRVKQPEPFFSDGEPYYISEPHECLCEKSKGSLWPLGKCSNCGGVVWDDMKYCPSCGFRIKSIVKEN